MSVTQRLMKPGTWSLRFKQNCPRSIWSKPDVFDHVVITPTRLQPIGEYSDANILSNAIYTGVIHTLNNDHSLAGAGLEYWLGTPSGLGYMQLIGVGATSTPLALSVVLTGHPSLLEGQPITAGTINDSGLPTKSNWSVPQNVTPREALDAICLLYGAEWRINPNATLDAALASNLFVMTPTVVVTRLPEGQEGAYRGLASESLGVSRDVQEYTNGILYVNKYNIPVSSPRTSPYKDFNNSAVNMWRNIDIPSPDDLAAAAVINNALDAYMSVRSVVTLGSDTYSVGRFVKPGDYVYVWDQAADLSDSANQITYRGELISPIKLRVYAFTWPIAQGMGVYLRESGATPTYTDLSDVVEWESGEVQWEVGATAIDVGTPSYGSTAYLGINPLVAVGTAKAGSGAPSGTGSDGQEYYDTTNHRLYRSDGTGWIIMYEPPQAWTVSLANFTKTSDTGSWYQRRGGMCRISADVTVSACAGVGTLTLPVATAGIPVAGLNVAFVDTGTDLAMGINSAAAAAATTVSLRVVNVAGTYARYSDTSSTVPHTWAATDKVQVSGEFRMNTPYL